ncbi:MAG: hypothetical protein ACE5FJ_06975 [Gemmatimonadales bacterium]
MPAYKVLRDYPLLHDGTEYAKGSTVEMTETQAKPLIAKKRLQKVAAKKKSTPSS